ncbi:MAG TPA: hypothetical protein VMU50_02370, partial [Polyangia bacterium]|nr:hypothetical protein [Polyangia bacterium]
MEIGSSIGTGGDRSRRVLWWRWLVVAALLVSAAGRAQAAALRFQVNQRGDFVLLGNTVGQDCGPGVVAPALGTVGACGNNTADTAPDIFWRSDDATNT